MKIIEKTESEVTSTCDVISAILAAFRRQEAIEAFDGRTYGMVINIGTTQFQLSYDEFSNILTRAI